MTAQTVVLLLFLVLIKDVSSNHHEILFELEERSVKAVEGSCAELKCSVVSSRDVQTEKAHWFWMKDAQYVGKDPEKKFEGTVIYSSNPEIRSVSPDYKDRVTYKGSPPTNWKYLNANTKCSVLLCNLNKTDSGEYAFRYIGLNNKIWITNPNITLNVTKNPCPITFNPPVVNASNTITLECSTLSSCTSELQIKRSKRDASVMSPQNNQLKMISSSFEVTWEDDGKEVSCQTSGDDQYLIRKVNLTVQYAPRDVNVESPKGIVQEKQSFTLTCSAKGKPTPTFTWFVNGTKRPGDGAELKFDSITVSQSGNYSCKARNILGTQSSEQVSIDVKYLPEVEVTASQAHEVDHGEKINLTCTVTRSKPEPTKYSWFKDNKEIENRIKAENRFFVEHVTPEDRGSYTCKATNTVGTAASAPYQLKVRYKPKTRISYPVNNIEVEVGELLQFICEADAYPSPNRYSWYRYNTDRNRLFDHSQWTPQSTVLNSMSLQSVKRTDDACYMCNATNGMGTGEFSQPVCIQVLYPPTNPRLEMDSLVNEGQLTTIRCTVESFPPSKLTLSRKSKSNPRFSEVLFTDAYRDSNSLNYRFNATSDDYGVYTCEAGNKIGSNTRASRELVVKYRPKNVKVNYQPDVVNENKQLTLDCSADSHPVANQFIWFKEKDGVKKSVWTTRSVTVKSASPSDSGLYTCTATNQMGSGQSPPQEIKVRYAPKLIQINKGAEMPKQNGQSSVTLTCISDGHPEATEFTWYKRTQEDNVQMSNQKKLIVSSDEPGDYFCIANNGIGVKKSDPIQVFVDRSFVKILIIFFFLLILVVLLLLIVYRRRKKKSAQRANSNTPSSFGSLGWWSRLGKRNEPTIAEPFRSRDDLLTDQPPRTNGQRRQQLHPDNTPASNSAAVYYTVNLPKAQQGPSGKTPTKQKAPHTQDQSLNYASVHFKNKEKPKKKQEDVDTVCAVYAAVSKNKTPKTTEQENQEDYENLKTSHAAKSPNPPSYDSDTSEEEEELNYTKVSFNPKPGNQRTRSDSSSSSSTSSTSSEEEATQYSQVKA